jgi:hypothetical protein
MFKPSAKYSNFLVFFKDYEWLIPSERASKKEIDYFLKFFIEFYDPPRKYSVPEGFDEKIANSFLLQFQDEFEGISFGKSNFHGETSSLTVSEEEINSFLLQLQDEFEALYIARDVTSDGLKSPVVGGEKVKETSKVVDKKTLKQSEIYKAQIKKLRLQHEKNHATHAKIQSKCKEIVENFNILSK